MSRKKKAMGKRYEVVDDLQDWRRDMIEAHHIIINLKKKHGKFDEISTTFFRPFPANWSRIQVDSFWDAKTRPSDTESCFLIS